MDNRPIGIFDSGLGGLTAVKELRALLPSEDILYFGDTGRVPYGGRSRNTIQRYAAQDVAFLLSHGVKVVLSACGTVSSVAGDQLLESCPCPFLEVVAPAASRAARLSVTGKIGVIATRATIASGRFQAAILAVNPTAQVTAIHCPLFVPLVEEGHISAGDDLVQKTVQLYLAAMRSRDVDTLILGCTHYPLLAEAIGNYMGKGVLLVDSGKEAAKATAERLAELGLLQESGAGSCRCFITDTSDNFAQVAATFLGESVGTPEQVSLEDLETISCLSKELE